MEPQELIASFGEYVDHGEATILVGAGLSLEADYPGWSDLMAPVREALQAPAVDDLPLLAQYYVNEHSEEALQRLVRQELHQEEPPEPLESHRRLASLRLAEIWTTNYDDLIERAVGNDARAYVADNDLAQVGSGTGCRVYKMHGSLTSESTQLVIARDQYIRYPDSHPRFWALLQASFLTKSFLFIGFSFSDPNFDHVFDIVRRARHVIHRQHFAIMRRPDDAESGRPFDLQLKDLESIGINVALIKEYSEMPALLKQLAARCRPRRLFVSGSPPDEKAATASDEYPSIDLPEAMSDFADLLGSALATTDVNLSAGGSFGAQVGYALLKSLDANGRSISDRFTLFRRRKDRPLDEPSHRYGSIVFRGTTANELRDAALAEARALLAVGGGSGTADEIRQAHEDGLGVVPIGRCGGSALEEWTRLNERLGDYRLGGLPVDQHDFRLLHDGAPEECAAAAARLAQQALYIRPGG